jgi:RNA polymerase I-specific transcription initiation factor RRN5
MPCANCVSSGVDCVYPENLRKTIMLKPDPPATSQGDHAMVDNTAGTKLLQAIPQATLLHPEMMLTLSKHLFMNRSDDIPSPWPHWSHYSSELAEAPSMYRTALNDFHSLVVSLTKRLVQTSIVQATSRLRAQRSRNKKGSLPMVRPRDIYTAIDTLGMKRNGSERWRGVPRRCGLRVTTNKQTPQGKQLREVREVPWDEVECIMSSANATEAESSAEPEWFRSRAARGGTPLPMHNLTISDSGNDDDVVERAVITDSDNSDHSESLNDDGPRAAARQAPQSEGLEDSSENVPLYSAAEQPAPQLYTLEDFDCEASRLEESTLWTALGMQEATKSASRHISDGRKEDDIEIDEKITTTSDHWRQYQDYRAPWEIHKISVSTVKLLANQKPFSPMPVSYSSRLRSTGSASGDFSNQSSTAHSRGEQRISKAGVELHARGTNAYAALRRDNLEGSDVEVEASNTDTTNPSIEEDTVAQSIEPEGDTVRLDEDEDEMDWT